ncbi:hypothetical protein UACE39S_04555 [Ureibacillus acetophenoni]
MKKKIIKGGKIVTATDSFEADILIEGEKIVQIGKDLVNINAEIVEYDRKICIPRRH